MKIDEVERHIGEEWRQTYGSGRYADRAGRGSRVRIERIVQVPEKRYGMSGYGHTTTVQVRRVQVTVLDPETGGQIGDGTVKAAELYEPWEGYWGRVLQARDTKAQLNALAERLEPYFGHTFGVDAGGRCLTLQLSIPDAIALVERLES